MNRSQVHIHNIERGLLSLLFLFMLLLPTLGFPADFSARTIGSYGNVVVMEVEGNYDLATPGGQTNGEPREVIAKEFFKTYKDEYDFLAIFTNFDIKMSTDAVAFYEGIKNDVSGIGVEKVDNSRAYGSDGKLQGTIDMGNINSLAYDPQQEKFAFVLDTLEHETLHRWCAHAKFRAADGSISSALLGSDGSHWSFLLDSRASVQYGNQWRDNGDGTFTSIAARKYYSPLDLYLMGMADKSEVPPMLLIENPAIDPARGSQVGATISGTAHYVTIDDIIAAEGERVPSFTNSQKSFKTAFILATAPGTFTGDELHGIEAIRNEWIKRFSIHTDGRGIMQVSLIPGEDIPVNPGPPDPAVNPRTLPPSLADAVKWLQDNQKPDGSWYDLAKTAERDTSEVVYALRGFPSAQWSSSNGIQWLLGTPSGNTDYLSRRIEIFRIAGQDTSSLINELLSKKNQDGGWGGDKTYVSNPIDTSFALRALSAVGHSDGETISKAVEYLKAKQNIDGGWGSGEGSNIEVTANVLIAFNKFKEQYQLQDPIIKGMAWLSQKQNPDGGFGNSPSTVYDTALALIAFQENSGPRTIINNGLNYIYNLQSKDGSWYGSPHQTALAIAAVWTTKVDPDLAVRSEDITFVPSAVKTLPANIAISARVWNYGVTGVPQAKVVLYEGSVSDANRIDEQTVAIAGGSAVDISFAAVIRDGEDHQFYVQIDPDNLVKESDETNNLAFNTIRPTPTYDFEILPADVAASPNELVINNNLLISCKITNKGTMNAYNVPVRYMVDDPAGPVEILTRNVNIPAGRSISDQIVWNANKAGENLPITVWADPTNRFIEESKTNNKASALVTVWTATVEPDLSIRSSDITFAPPVTTLPAAVSVNARIANLGRTDVPQAKAVLYDGAVSEAAKAGEQLFSVSGQSFAVISFPVTLRDGNEHRFYVQLDPENLINESNKANNLASNDLKPVSTYDFEVLASDLTISPNPVETTNDVTISAKISNKGTMNAYNVTVRYTIDDSGVPVDIATRTIDIPANSTVSNQITWKADREGKNMPLAVLVDPFNSFAEISKANNKATAQLTVNGSKDPNLAVSYKDIAVDPAVPNENGDAKISAIVRNTGASAADNVTVNCYRGVPGTDGVLIGSQVITAVAAGESRSISFDWTNIKDSGEKIIYIKVDPANSIKETSKEDNDAFTTIKILSLPDLAISTSSITFAPSAPKEGDTVLVSVTVKNLGEQNVRNVSVSAYENGSVIGTQTIPAIAGNSQAGTSFSFDTKGRKGAHEISVVVDPENAISERGKENNRASRSFGVQDATLWVTEPYISPNGDGIKDSTQFFFTLKSAQAVKVAVVNEAGEAVRTFSGGALDYTSGDNVVWDGRNDGGTIVDDGQYQLRVIDEQGSTAGAVNVVVDNNRSPLVKAIGTRFLQNNNLTCMLPGINRWEWLPDESGILLMISTTETTNPEYPSGLYLVSPDGGDIQAITPPEWNSDPQYTYSISEFKMSPDGEKISLSLQKSAMDRTRVYELWVLDRDGSNPRVLHSYNALSSEYGAVRSLGWFNNDYVLFEIDVSAGDYASGIWVVRTDGSGKARIDDFPDDYTFSTSPDGNRIAYKSRGYFRVSDVAGNKKNIMQSDEYTWYYDIKWIDQQKIFVRIPGSTSTVRIN